MESVQVESAADLSSASRRTRLTAFRGFVARHCVQPLLISVTALAGIAPVWGQTEVVVIVSGDVRMEDGTAPPEAVQIDRVCNGRTILAARTDSMGHFNFSLGAGGSAAATADAGQAPPQAANVNKALNASSTQYTNPITTELRDCEIHAVLPGFRTESVPLSIRDTSDNGRVGTITLHPLSRPAALTISVTTAAAPASARKVYDQAMESIAKEKWPAAESGLGKAVKIYPKFAIAWYQLGIVRQKRNALSDAVEAWKEAVKQDPKYLKPYESLAALADQREDWTAAEEYSREWLRLDPNDFAAAYLINAIANARLNRIEAAERAARTGLEVDKDRKIPRLSYVMGLILLQKQQYPDAAKYLRAYLELAPNARDAAIVREQVAKLDQQTGGKPHFPQRPQNAELAWAKRTVVVPSMSRSGNVDEQKPIFLERLPLELTVELPVGSRAGAYELQLKMNDRTMVSTGGNAEIRNGATTFTVRINLSGFDAGNYSMVVRQVPLDWNLYPVVIR